MNSLADLLTVLAAILTLASAYFAWRSQMRKQLITRLEDKIAEFERKIQRYTIRVDPESDRKLIKTAIRSIQVLGINCLGLLHHSREDILLFLQQGGRFQIVMLDPRKPAFGKRAELEEDHVGRIIAEWHASAKILSGINDKLGATGRIEIKLYDETPDRSLVMVDGIDQLTENTSVLINYYPEKRGVRGYEGGVFLAQQRIPRDQDSLEKNWNYFAAVWANAEPVDIKELGRLQASVSLDLQSSQDS